MFNFRVSLLNLWRYNRALLGVADPDDGEFAVPVSEASPLPVRVIGGGGVGGGSAPAVTATYPPQALTASAAEVPLTVPAGATHALVTVTSGRARLGLGNAATAPVYAAGEGVEISGAQLAALRLIRDGGADAAVRVDYWRVA